MRRKCLTIAGCVGIALAGTNAHAQRAGATQLEEIVVTAQRREEALLSTPVTVTALSGDLLEQQNVRTMTDLVPLTPGLEIEPDGGRTAIRLRGLATSDGSPAAENIAALHVDNIYISHRTSLAGYFFDVQRVEVLQGPQGTLYGRNTAAGSINIISRRPTQEQGGSGEVEFGNYSHIRVQGALNVPVTTTLALRGAFQSMSDDGYFESGVDQSRSTYARLGAQWDPVERVSLYAKLDFGDSWERGNGVGLLGTIDASDPDNWQANWFSESDWLNDSISHPGDVPASLDGINQASIQTKQWGAMGELTLGLTDNIDAIISASRHEEDYKAYTIGVNGQLGGGTGTVWAGISSDRVKGHPWVEKTYDVRLQGTLTDQLQFTLGYFYWRDDTNEPGAGNPNGIAFHAPVSLADSDAVYGQVTWTPPGLDRLHLTGGARHTNDWKQWDFQVIFNPIDIIVGGSGGLLTKEWSNTDYKFGLAWDLGGQGDGVIYANYSTGYRAGSWFPGPIPAYNPEYVDAYELGWKNRLLDNRLQAGFNTYYYDYQDKAIQFDSFNTLSMEDEIGYANLGDAEIYGFNLNGDYVLTDSDLVTLNVDYTHAKIVKFDFASVAAQFPPNYSFDNVFDWTGLQLPNTTPWRLTLAWTHTFTLGNGGGLDSRLQVFWNDARYANYRSDTLTQYKFDGFKIDSYFLADWNVEYRPPDGGWHLGFYVRNIFDKIVPQNLGSTTSINGTLALQPVPNGDDYYINGRLRPPRTFGVRVGLDF